MDLKKLNVVELNAQEMQNTDGGIIPLIIIGAALILTGCTSQTNNNNAGSTSTNVNGGNSNSGSGTQNNTEVTVGVKPTK